MKTRYAAVALAATAALTLAACGGSPAASIPTCRAAMTQQLNYAEAHAGSGAKMGEPAGCKGLSASTLKRIAGQVVRQAFEKKFG